MNLLLNTPESSSSNCAPRTARTYSDSNLHLLTERHMWNIADEAKDALILRSGCRAGVVCTSQPKSASTRISREAVLWLVKHENQSPSDWSFKGTRDTDRVREVEGSRSLLGRLGDRIRSSTSDKSEG
nr:hypothetical protein CFP56_19423 [Quercus suber]